MIDEFYSLKVVISGKEGIDASTQFDPNTPDNYTKIHTEHTCPASILDWSLVTCSNVLLSVDEQDTICVWKCKESCVNDYVLAARFYMEGVLSAKWIHSERRYLAPKEDDQSSETLSDRYTTGLAHVGAIPAGTKSFLCICRNGQVHLCFMDLSRQQWVSSSIHLNVEDIEVADFTVRHDGTIMIACAGTNKYSVHLFHCALKKVSPVTETNMPVSRVQLTLEEHTVFTLPLSPSLISHSDHAGISRLQFIPFQSDVQELIIVCNNNQIQKWRCIPSSVYVSNVLCAVSSTQDGLPLQPTTEVVEEVNNNTTVRERPLWTQSHTVTLKDDISALQCSQDGLFCYAGFTNGRIRQYRLSDLELVAETPDPNTQSPQKNDSSNRDDEPPLKKAKTSDTTSTQYQPSAIQSIAISPNHTCIATIDSAHILHLYSIFLDKDEEPNTEVARRIKNKFELSILNYFDNWDIFAIIWKHLNQSQTEEVHSLLDKSKKQLSKLNRRFYQTHYERLNTILCRMIGGRRLSTLVQLQATIITQSIHNTFKNYVYPGTVPDDKDPTLVLQAYEKAFIDKINPDARVKKACLSLIPLSNWTCEYAFFFFKDMQEYVTRLTKVYNREEKIPSFSSFYSLHHLKLPQMIAMMRELIKHAYALTSLFYDPENSKIVQTAEPPRFSKDQLKTLFCMVNDAYKLSSNIAKTVQKESVDPLSSRDTYNAIKDIVNNSLTHMQDMWPLVDRLELIERLDLMPKLRGVLAGEYWRVDGSAAVANVPTTPSKLGGILIDVVTRQEIYPDAGNYRTCKLCSRVTATHLKGWASRWTNACMMCTSSFLIN